MHRGERRATGQTSHGGSWLTTTAQGAVAGDRTLCSAYFWKHRDAWHPPGAAPHSNKPRSSCHNIFPLEGAGVSVIATWCFLEAVLIPSPLSRLSRSSRERRTLGRAEAEGPGAADCPTQGATQSAWCFSQAPSCFWERLVNDRSDFTQVLLRWERATRSRQHSLAAPKDLSQAWPGG